MLKTFLRIVAGVLVFCLVAEPATSAARPFLPPVRATRFSFYEKPCDSQALASLLLSSRLRLLRESPFLWPVLVAAGVTLVSSGQVEAFTFSAPSAATVAPHSAWPWMVIVGAAVAAAVRPSVSVIREWLLKHFGFFSGSRGEVRRWRGKLQAGLPPDIESQDDRLFERIGSPPTVDALNSKEASAIAAIEKILQKAQKTKIPPASDPKDKGGELTDPSSLSRLVLGVRELKALNPEERLLELGAGAGGPSIALAQRFGVKVDAMEIQHSQRVRGENAVHRAEAQGLVAENQVRFIKGDFLSDPDWRDYDAFYFYAGGGSINIHHLPAAAIAGMKPGARLIVLGADWDGKNERYSFDPYLGHLFLSGLFEFQRVPGLGIWMFTRNSVEWSPGRPASLAKRQKPAEPEKKIEDPKKPATPQDPLAQFLQKVVENARAQQRWMMRRERQGTLHPETISWSGLVLRALDARKKDIESHPPVYNTDGLKRNLSNLRMVVEFLTGETTFEQVLIRLEQVEAKAADALATRTRMLTKRKPALELIATMLTVGDARLPAFLEAQAELKERFGLERIIDQVDLTQAGGKSSSSLDALATQLGFQQEHITHDTFSLDGQAALRLIVSELTSNQKRAGAPVFAFAREVKEQRAIEIVVRDLGVGFRKGIKQTVRQSQARSRKGNRGNGLTSLLGAVYQGRGTVTIESNGERVVYGGTGILEKGKSAIVQGTLIKIRRLAPAPPAPAPITPGSPVVLPTLAKTLKKGLQAVVPLGLMTSVRGDGAHAVFSLWESLLMSVGVFALALVAQWSLRRISTILKSRGLPRLRALEAAA